MLDANNLLPWPDFSTLHAFLNRHRICFLKNICSLENVFSPVPVQGTGTKKNYDYPRFSIRRLKSLLSIKNLSQKNLPER
jgi:hypothetical protein